MELSWDSPSMTDAEVTTEIERMAQPVTVTVGILEEALRAVRYAKDEAKDDYAPPGSLVSIPEFVIEEIAEWQAVEDEIVAALATAETPNQTKELP